MGVSVPLQAVHGVMLRSEPAMPWAELDTQEPQRRHDFFVLLMLSVSLKMAAPRWEKKKVIELKQWRGVGTLLTRVAREPRAFDKRIAGRNPELVFFWAFHPPIFALYLCKSV